MGNPIRLKFPMKSLGQLRTRLGVSETRQDEILDILGVRSEDSSLTSRSASKTSVKRSSAGRKAARAKSAR